MPHLCQTFSAELQAKAKNFSITLLSSLWLIYFINDQVNVISFICKAVHFMEHNMVI